MSFELQELQETEDDIFKISKECVKFLFKATSTPKGCITAIMSLLRGILAQPGETQVPRFHFSIRQVSGSKEQHLQADKHEKSQCSFCNENV